MKRPIMMPADYFWSQGFQGGGAPVTGPQIRFVKFVAEQPPVVVLNTYITEDGDTYVTEAGDPYVTE